MCVFLANNESLTTEHPPKGQGSTLEVREKKEKVKKTRSRMRGKVIK